MYIALQVLADQRVKSTHFAAVPVLYNLKSTVETVTDTSISSLLSLTSIAFQGYMNAKNLLTL